ncbi:hypothetical protein GLDPPO_GLDPPO_02170, partial [Dysosmobacter welbionis]
SKRTKNSLTSRCENGDRSSWKERKGNALASGAEEGRDKLRKASGRSKYPLIRGYPNGATRLDNIQSSCVEQNRRRK